MVAADGIVHDLPGLLLSKNAIPSSALAIVFESNTLPVSTTHVSYY